MVQRPLKVSELIKALERCPPDAEVRIAHQPLWPFEYRARGVVSDVDLRKASSGCATKTAAEVVWIVEGELVGTFTIEAWRVATKATTRS
jgi:hypothetical protein